MQYFANFFSYERFVGVCNNKAIYEDIQKYDNLNKIKFSEAHVDLLTGIIFYYSK